MPDYEWVTKIAPRPLKLKQKTTMDALPLSFNQHQLKLMHEKVNQAIADLQSKNQAKQFASGDDKKKEQNILNYGTDNYQEAYDLVQAINDQLESHLKAWNDDPEVPQPVEISLNSYQLRVLRTSIEQEIDNPRDQQAKHLLENIIEQLPEFSANEQSE
ncbi:MAG: hypothetical protein DSM106950_41165 [Stigonema ocellatum SAG 48.90 = DSM 106950]|nr:hypothetical protein [Stigonema ocellatum SAG 48.90 = DSM 106950]